MYLIYVCRKYLSKWINMIEAQCIYIGIHFCYDVCFLFSSILLLFFSRFILWHEYISFVFSLQEELKNFNHQFLKMIFVLRELYILYVSKLAEHMHSQCTRAKKQRKVWSLWSIEWNEFHVLMCSIISVIEMTFSCIHFIHLCIDQSTKLRRILSVLMYYNIMCMGKCTDVHIYYMDK